MYECSVIDVFGMLKPQVTDDETWYDLHNAQDYI